MTDILPLILLQECADTLRSDLSRGLLSAEASRRQKYNGFNEFDITEHEPIWKKYIEQVAFDASLSSLIRSYAL